MRVQDLDLGLGAANIRMSSRKEAYSVRVTNGLGHVAHVIPHSLWVSYDLSHVGHATSPLLVTGFGFGFGFGGLGNPARTPSVG